MTTTRIQSSPLSPVVDRIVNIPEAARLLGVSAATVRRCCARRELRLIRLSPRRVGLRLSDLAAFIDARAT